jgi:hypothetical protein
MSTEEEIYRMAMAQTGKSFKELDDDDLLSALGTDNAIARSKDDDPEEQERLKKSVLAANRLDGHLPSAEDAELDKTLKLLRDMRRRAGLNENAVRYRVRVKVKGRTAETIVWAENRIEAELLATAQFGENSVMSAPRRA